MDYEEYKKLRERFGTSPREVVRMLRLQNDPNRPKNDLPDLRWESGYGRDLKVAHFEYKGFQVSAHVEVDQDDCTAYLGKLVRKWEPGAIRVNPRELEWRERHIPTYFVPEISIAEHRGHLHASGYSKAVAEERAREIVYQDMRRFLEFGETWWTYILVAKACKHGVLLGEHGLGGVEFEDEEELRQRLWEDNIVDEAVDEAEKTLKKLCECPGSQG